MNKVLLLLTIAGCLMAFSAVQAQVIADFEVEALGTQGFADNGWGKGLTGVNRIADPTGRSAGVLAVGFDGSLCPPEDVRGDFEKMLFSPKKAHIISIMVYLPSNFPDEGSIEFFGQDNSHWSHTTQSYAGKDLPKQKWIALNFYLYSRFLTNPNFNPYDPNMFGRWGVQINGTPTFAGQLLFDDVTLLGDEPKYISNFEVEALGLDGWFNANWGPGLAPDGIQRIADPTGRSKAVLSVSMDASLGTRATLEKDNVSISDDDHAIGVMVWVPTGFPDDAYIQIVGQDNIYWAWHPQVYYGVDLKKDQWNELYYDVLSRYTIDKSSFDPYTNHTWGKLIIDIDNNKTFTGSLYFDDIAYFGPAPPPTAELLSPAITVTAGVTTVTDPFTGAILYHNDIRWTDLSADIGESYSLYYSESGKITDVTAPGVIQISTQIPRGVGVFHHRMYTVNGEEKTVWYAMTVTGLEGGQIVEKPVRDGISNSGPVTAKTSLLYEIPLVESFKFDADAYLDEFDDIAKTFTRCVLRNENASGAEAAAWTPESKDLNFTGYVVMDPDYLYVGMAVTDDYPYGDGQVWAGDGFDMFGGLYDVRTLTSLFRGTDCQRGGTLGGGYRLGPAIGASQGEHMQISGYDPWTPNDWAYAQDIFSDGYIVEFKISFDDLNSKFNASFTPADGMLLPLKFDINDNDSSVAGNYRTLQNHFGDVPGNFQGWMRAEAWAAPVILTKTPLPPITSVKSQESPLPYAFSLSQNYPNPFNPGTTLKYQLPHPSEVTIVVYDVLGKEICTLVDGKKEAGSYTVTWNGTNNAGIQVSSGIYFCKMSTPEFTLMRKMTLLR
ncbi:MAG: T9SS type A sorting domain-containing protein [candidate division KSB1 bacterium]|nr:T9SS type A sorting domain-containing protein [candidate division KSB1 bacterium]